MFSNKLDSAIWIADEFPTMLSQMKKQGLQIRQKGEIKVDKRINKLVLYKNPYNGTLNLEFLTVDDSNYLYKLSFVTYPPFFDKYRPDFEATKESLKYTRFSLEQ